MILELVFWSLKRFGRFEAVASLDAYQITNYQFPSKTHHFVVCFRRIREEVSKLGILWPIARRDQKVHLIFFKNCAPRGIKFFFKWFQNERKCLFKWVYYQH